MPVREGVSPGRACYKPLKYRLTGEGPPPFRPGTQHSVLMLVEILLALSCGVAGLLCGWIAYPAVMAPAARHFRTRSGGAEASASVSPAGTEEPAEAAAHQERMMRIALHLQSLARAVADRVDAHREQLQSVSHTVKSTDLRHNPEGVVEAVARLLDANDSLHEQLDQMRRRLDAQSEMLQSAERAALTDPLTEVANRRGFDQFIDEVVDREADRPVTLMLLDIDHFKQFNDAYGHQTGDLVLRHVAAQLEEAFGAGGIVARFGGEEFVVVFRGRTLAESGADAEQTRLTISATAVEENDQQLRVTCSAGLAQRLADEPLQSWLERADAALYTAKANQRDCAYAETDGAVLRLSAERVPAVAPQAADPPVEGTQQREETAAGWFDTDLEPASLPRSLRDLPIGNRILEDFDALAETAQESGSTFICAVVQLEAGAIDDDRLRSATRAIRSAVRSVDRIGILDRRTLVVGMPSLGHEAALMRAEKIRASLVVPGPDGQPHSASVALAGSGQFRSFPKMLKKCLDMLATQPAAAHDRMLAAWL